MLTKSHKKLQALKYLIHALLFSFFCASFSLVWASEFDVEDPYICKHTLAKYKQPIAAPSTNLERLINAVTAHCLDEHQASIELLSPVLQEPVGLTTDQITYAHILHSINLNNVGNDAACEYAKLSMAHAANSTSKPLSIRTELNYFSFCELYEENTPHALKRLYELSKEAIEIDSLYLQMNIHNQISYVYYMLDQNQLSAEEGEKALVLSEQLQSDDYEIVLFNLIDAYLDAGDLSLAEKYISHFKAQINENSTKWSRYLSLYAQTYLAYLQKQYRVVLDLDREILAIETEVSPSLIQRRAIVKGLSCSALNNIECVASVMAQHFSKPQWSNIDRLMLLELYIKWFSYKKDWEKVANAQQRYFDLTYQKLTLQQQAAKILGVAKLNNEVIRLNSEKTLKQLDYQSNINRVYFIALVVLGALLVVFIAVYWHLKRRVSQQIIAMKGK